MKPSRSHLSNGLHSTSSSHENSNKDKPQSLPKSRRIPINRPGRSRLRNTTRPVYDTSRSPSPARFSGFSQPIFYNQNGPDAQLNSNLESRDSSQIQSNTLASSLPHTRPRSPSALYENQPSSTISRQGIDSEHKQQPESGSQALSFPHSVQTIRGHHNSLDYQRPSSQTRFANQDDSFEAEHPLPFVPPTRHNHDASYTSNDLRSPDPITQRWNTAFNSQTMANNDNVRQPSIPYHHPLFSTSATLTHSNTPLTTRKHPISTSYDSGNRNKSDPGPNFNQIAQIYKNGQNGQNDQNGQKSPFSNHPFATTPRTSSSSWDQDVADAMRNHRTDSYATGHDTSEFSIFDPSDAARSARAAAAREKSALRLDRKLRDLKSAISTFGATIEFNASTVDPGLEHKLQKWREFGEKYREREIQLEIKNRKIDSSLKEITTRIFNPVFAPATENDRFGLDPTKIGTRHEYSDLQPFIFSSEEFPSVLKEDTRKFLEKTGLKRYTDMVYELYDDVVDHLNKAEPFGQRPGKRKYRLKNKLNKPYVRFSLDELETELRSEQSQFHEIERDYWIQRDINERKSLALKRKARRAMGLEPDLHLESRWAQLTSEAPARIKPPAALSDDLMRGDTHLSDFEKFRAEFKKKEDVYNEKKNEGSDDEHARDPTGRDIKAELKQRGADAQWDRGPVFRPPAYTHAEAVAKAKLQHGAENAEIGSSSKLLGKKGKGKPRVLEAGEELFSDDEESEELQLDGRVELGGSEDAKRRLRERREAKRASKSIIRFEGEGTDDEDAYFDAKGNRVDADGNLIGVKRSFREDQGKRDFWLEKSGNPTPREGPGPDDEKSDRLMQRSGFRPDPEDPEAIKLRKKKEKERRAKSPARSFNESLDRLTEILERQSELLKNEDGSGEKSGWYDLKPRRIIHDDKGLSMHRDDLFGYPVEYLHAMPVDEEDMNELEREHWKRRVRQANHRKYFKHGWKYETRWGTGPKYKASELGYMDPAKIQEGMATSHIPFAPQRRELTHFGFQGLGAPGNDSITGSVGVYDYIYGRPIPQMKSHGGVLSIDLFREFPPMFRSKPADSMAWDGTTALTYDPQQNHITKWELRRQTLKHKLSMSPLGDLARWGFKMFNIDVFPFTHFRYPFGWIMAHARWAVGLRHALARWSKTAAHWYIDQRFAYQSNRFGEHQNEHIYHYINEYDYLKEYQLPTVLRAIREYDFDVLRSACSHHALFNIMKWLHIQDRFGVYYEYRRNYWVESLDIREVRKDEHNNLILDVEFSVIEPPYYYNKAGGKIFSEKSQNKWFFRPTPLIIEMSLLRDHTHPDFDYQVIDFKADARRIKRVFNNLERIYHSAQRSRTQYHDAPKFYAVRRTAHDRSYYSRRSLVVGAYQANIERPVFDEKELDFQEDMEDRYSNLIKYRDTMMMGPYLAALELEPVMDFMVAKVKEHPAFGLHPIQKDPGMYWAQRKELDLLKFRQREARRSRAQQNTLHRYFHKLRSLAYFKHTYDHGGNLEEFRRLHIDKLALDANHDDWFQKWFVDPERRGRPYFKNLKRFARRAKHMVWRKGHRKFSGMAPFGVSELADHGQGYRHQRILNRYKRFTKRFTMRYKPGSGKRRQRVRYFKRTRKGGHNMRRHNFKKRRRFTPYMERVYVQLARGGFWESRRFFKTRNHRINAFKGDTTHFSPKHKGPGYSLFDVSGYDRWHVWDGGYYNPLEACWTRADVFNPENQPFQPRRNYSYSFLEDHTTLIPFEALRNWDMPWRVNFPLLWDREGLTRPQFLQDNLWTDETVRPNYLDVGNAQKMATPRFEHLPNAEIFSLKDDDQYEDHTARRAWPVPQDDRWKL